MLIYEFSALNQNVLSFEDEKDVIEAKILNNNGRIVASINNAEEGTFANKDYELGESQKYLDNKLLSTEEIRYNDVYMGKAIIVLSLDSMHEKISYSVKMIIFILGVSFLFLLLFINFVSGYLLKPVITLADIVRKIPDRNFDIDNLKNQSPPSELQELYNSIIWMYEEMLMIRKRLIERTQMATIGKMSAYFAHEIRNPLEAMSGAVEVLKIKGDYSSKNNTFFDIIKEEIITLNKFLDEFLNFSRIKSYKFEKINLNKLVKDIFILLQPMFKAENIDLFYQVPERDYLVKGDLSKIKSVITNILLNSMEAINESGFVEIKLLKANNFVEIKIKDNGKGIDEKDLEKIFNPFFSTKKTGNGIGLSISKEIIESHNGEILVDSDNSTIFTIKLPVYEDENENEKDSNS
ncbi:MAG: sensor histidine kinase [Bacillota bacterium]